MRTSSMLGRYSSAIRAACANERSCGSVRGATSNGRPYRDLIIPVVASKRPFTSELSPDWTIATSVHNHILLDL